MVRTGLNTEGAPFAKVMTFDEYIENVTQMLEGVHFEESEVQQNVQVFGNVARLSSVYQYHYASDVEERRGRGVNLFSLVNEGDGWKVINIVWDNERTGSSLEESGLLT